MSMLFAYMAGREGVGGLEVLQCFVRGGQIFFYFLCVCICVWEEAGQTKKSQGSLRRLSFFLKILLVYIFFHIIDRRKINFQ